MIRTRHKSLRGKKGSRQGRKPQPEEIYTRRDLYRLREIAFRLSIGASKLDDLIRVKALRVVDLRTTPAKQRAEIRVRHVDLERFLRGLPAYAPRSAKFISRGALAA